SDCFHGLLDRAAEGGREVSALPCEVKGAVGHFFQAEASVLQHGAHRRDELVERIAAQTELLVGRLAPFENLVCRITKDGLHTADGLLEFGRRLNRATYEVTHA